jgi:hypothetical protein
MALCLLQLQKVRLTQQVVDARVVLEAVEQLLVLKVHKALEAPKEYRVYKAL